MTFHVNCLPCRWFKLYFLWKIKKNIRCHLLQFCMAFNGLRSFLLYLLQSTTWWGHPMRNHKMHFCAEVTNFKLTMTWIHNDRNHYFQCWKGQIYLQNSKGLTGFQVKQTQMYGRNHYLFTMFKGQLTTKVGKQESWFLWFTCCLIVVNISVNFDENISHSFKVTKWIWVYDGNHYLHSSKGYYSKSR